MFLRCLYFLGTSHDNFSWQKYFLERLNFKLTARLINALRTEEEKRKMTRTVIERINEVKNDLPTVRMVFMFTFLSVKL